MPPAYTMCPALASWQAGVMCSKFVTSVLLAGHFSNELQRVTDPLGHDDTRSQGRRSEHQSLRLL
eukprot:2734814-Amphidinium_carterae.1